MTDTPPIDTSGWHARRAELEAAELARSRAALRARNDRVGRSAPAPATAYQRNPAGDAADNAEQPEQAPAPRTGMGAIIGRVVARFLAPAAPKLHAADLESARNRRAGAAVSWSRASFMAAVHAAAEARTKGDPKAHTIAAVGQVLAARHDSAVAGTTVSLDAVAKSAGLCRETVRKCVRYLEAAELVDRINVMARRMIGGARRLVRDANLYLLRRPQADAPAELRRRSAQEPPAARQQRVIERCAAVLGLVPRHGGLAPLAASPDPP